MDHLSSVWRVLTIQSLLVDVLECRAWEIMQNFRHYKIQVCVHKHAHAHQICHVCKSYVDNFI